MSWFRANRVSVKDPLSPSSYGTPIRSSVDNKSKPTQDSDFSTPDKIRSNPSFSLERINSKTI